MSSDVALIMLEGRARAQALARFQRQLTKWGLAMPAVEPLVLDFGLGEFETTGLIEYWIANELKAGYCGKYLFVFDRQSCPMHCHHNKIETFFVVKGSVAMTCAGQNQVMNPGDILRVETRQPHGFMGLGPALLLEISQPCIVSDNYFDDCRIPLGGNYRPASQ
jgi:mannose-6-phosphate isomerase-like protein (cupin superfamily)